MVREFSAEGLIVLPRLGVDSALALWPALQAAVVAEKKLPRFVQPSWQSLDRAGKSLFEAAQARLASSKRPSAGRRKADAAVDNATSALDDFLAAWARHADTLPKGQVAAAVRQTLFPDGLGFLRMPYEKEWAQIDRRLALIKSEGLDKQIDLLGGTELVTILEDVQRAYGKVLGLTAVPELAPETVALKEPLATLAAALRLYVIKVTAYSDEDEPETVALSERLLRPLANWASKAPKSSGTDDSDPDSDPEPEPSPTPAGG